MDNQEEIPSQEKQKTFFHYFLFLSGIIKLIFVFLFIFSIIPQLTILYETLNNNSYNAVYVYTILGFLGFIALVEIADGFLLWSEQNKNLAVTDRSKKIGIWLLIIGVLSFFLLLPTLIISVVNPIYKLTTDIIENKPTTISPAIIQPSPTQYPTANWETFNFKDITFKYPEDWSEPDYIKNIAIIKSHDDSQKITVNEHDRNSTEQKLSKFINSLIINSENTSGEKLILDGSEAVKLKPKSIYPAPNITTIYIISKDKTFMYAMTFQTPYEYSNHDKLLQQILSTFKFTDQNQTTDATKIAQ